jgi:hypothetical protein
MQMGSRRIICINGNHSLERQRFTALHEVAHLYLEMPSKHGDVLSVDSIFRYSSKPREEILCDIFAAECLFPRHLFQRDLQKHTPSMQAIQTLAEEYEASLAATGSRFAAYPKEPCAWILADERRVRYQSRSPSMRDSKFWVQIGLEVPKMTVLGSLIAGTGRGEQQLIPHHFWTNNDCEGLLDIYEEAILTPSLSQGLAILWAEDLDEGDRPAANMKSEDDELLRELDGVLKFPGRGRRK